MMRIAVYSSPISAIGMATGVGQHIRHMAHELAARSDVEAMLLTGKKAYELVRPHLNGSFAPDAVKLLPGEKWMRWLLLGSGLAGVERWSGPVDWVYCPKEQPVCVKSARLAVTVHDVLKLEPDIVGLSEDLGWFQRMRWRGLMKRILRRAGLIATVSEFTKRRMVELLGVEENRIVVVGNGVSAVYFDAEAQRRADVAERLGVTGRQYVVSVGSLTKRKGGDRLIRLASAIRSRGLDIEILVTGRRHDELQLRQLAESGPLPIQLLGYVPDEDMPALLSGAIALLFLSRYEGFGIPAVEAMAAGTPVISTASAALPEVMGDAGVFVGGDDIEELFAAIALCSDSVPREALIDRGHKHAQLYTWSACAARLVDAMTKRM